VAVEANGVLQPHQWRDSFTLEYHMKFTGIVAEVLGHGCWLIEQDLTRDCIWVHQRYVVRRKFLHLNDRVRFSLITHVKTPNEVMADEVEIIGLTVARQVSDQGGGR
jgi:hypothetical protein